MRTAQILFCDPGLSRDLISELLARHHQMETVVLRDLFRETLTTTLKDEIRHHVDSGGIVPIETLERMILWGIQTKPRFLLVGYPRFVEQFESLMRFCTTYAISVDKLWYFKTEDYETI